MKKREKMSYNKKKVLAVRITEEQGRYLSMIATSLNTTPSRYVRMIIDSAVVACKREVEKGNIKIEDNKNAINGQL